jgi:Flp pilus assembly protein TadG
MRMGRRGVAAVEFALVAPVLLVLFMGTAEVLLLYRTQAKLNALASNIAEMVSLQDTPLPVSGTNVASLSDICTGAVYGLQPFPPKGLTVAVVSVTTTTAATSTVNGTYSIWEVDQPGGGCANAATAIGATTACALALDGTPGPMIPQSGGAAGDNVIIVRATLTYPGIVGVILGNAPTFTQTAYSRWINLQQRTANLTFSGTGYTTVSKTCA